MMISFLQEVDYYYKAASTPLEALEILWENHFDLLVSDRRMEDMEGLELIREIHSRQAIEILRFIRRLSRS